jgi:hypothetical protein
MKEQNKYKHLAESEKLGLFKKYDMSPELREAHDRVMKGLRTLTFNRIEAFRDEDELHGKF